MPNNFQYWLTIASLFPHTAAKIHKWLEKFPSIKHLLQATTEQLQAAGLSAAEIALIHERDESNIQPALTWQAQQTNHHLICYEDDRYPILLKQLKDAPLILYVKGDATLLSQPQLAMVGTRNPSATGREIAEQFAYSLAQAGLVITSGLALGIDGAAHRGALKAKKPTIAVMGTGLKHIYPASHKKIAQEISEEGALISEFPLDTEPYALNFPRRNRIISGMTLGTVVIEAALRSGSLITARFAAEEGREVFAVPGSIYNPLARGCHHLLRQGAKLVETAADILEELGMLEQLVQQTTPAKPSKLDSPHRDLLACVNFETTPMDAIIVRSGLTVSQVSSMLLTLELQGLVNFASGGWVRVAQNSFNY